MRVLLLTVLLSAVLFVLKGSGQSCNYTLSGIVQDTSGAVIPGALIHMTHHEQHLHATTDSAGVFSFVSLCSGTYILHIDYVGYQHKDFTIVVPTTLPVKCELQLQQAAKAVVIEGIRETDVFHSSYNTVLTTSDLRSQRGQTITEMVQQVPGVSMLSTGSTISKPVVQGMYGSRVLLFHQGVRLEGQQWGNEHAPEVDPFLASQVEVIRGAQSIRYGADAIGGVILTSAPPLGLQSGWHGSLYTGYFSNNRLGYCSGVIDYQPQKINALAFRAQGTIRRAGNSRTPDYYLDNTGLKEYNFSWAGQYKWKTGKVEVNYSQFNTVLGIFTGAHIGNLTDLQQVIQSGSPYLTAPFSYTIGNPKQDITHETWSTAIEQYAFKSKWHLQYSRQYNRRAEYDINSITNDFGLRPALQFELTTQTVSLKQFTSFAGIRWNNGIWYQHQKNTYEGRYFIPNFISNAAALYVSGERRLSNRTTWEFGGRIDLKEITSYFYQNQQLVAPERIFVSPVVSTGVQVKWNTKSISKLWMGNSFRAPNVNELYADGVHHGVAAVEKGSPDLQAEQALNLSLHHSYTRNRYSIFAHAYSYYFFNYIYLQPVQPPTLTIRGAFPTFEYRQAKTVYWGFDIGIRDSIGKDITWQSTWSSVSARNLDLQEWVPYIPSSRWMTQIQYLLPVLKKWNCSVGANVQVVFQKEQVEAEQDYMPPPAGYALSGLQTNAVLPIGKQTIHFNIQVKNLFNVVYRDYLDRFRYYHDAVGRNIQFRIQYQF